LTDKNSWDIKQLQREAEDSRAVDKDHEARLRSLESFRDSTVEKLITVFNRLDELQEGDQWIKRVIVTSLVTGVIGAVISLIVWAIQN
jgi:chromosome segregation ATPase